MFVQPKGSRTDKKGSGHLKGDSYEVQVKSIYVWSNSQWDGYDL